MSRRSALHALTGAQSDVHSDAKSGAPLPLAERAFLGHINLRGDARDPAFSGAVRSALGVDLPVAPNTLVRRDDGLVAWLGPDEWIVQTGPDAVDSTLGALRQALSGLHSAVTDTSEGNTVVVLDHPRACAILSRGCPLDLHESAFPVGACAQSIFAKASVLLVREAPDRFAITVRRSFAPYLFHALQDAGTLELAA